MFLNKYIFPLIEIESKIFSYLDIFKDFKNLILVNKYYSELINENELYGEVRKLMKYLDLFHCNKKNHSAFKKENIVVDNDLLKKYIVSIELKLNKLAIFMNPKCDLNFELFPNEKMKFCCIFNNVEFAQWIFQKYFIKSLSELNLSEYLSICCFCNNSKMLNWIINISKIYKLELKISTRMFLNGCIYNNIYIISLLSNIYSFKKNQIVKGFRICCEKGYLKLATWILNNYKNIEKGCFIGSNSFDKCCENGHFKMAKYLLKVMDKKYPLQISYNKFNCFRKSCLNNHFEIANWLLDHIIKRGLFVNLNKYLPNLIIKCCRKNLYEMVKFLIISYLKYDDIHIFQNQLINVIKLKQNNEKTVQYYDFRNWFLDICEN